MREANCQLLKEIKCIIREGEEVNERIREETKWLENENSERQETEQCIYNFLKARLKNNLNEDEIKKLAREEK